MPKTQVHPRIIGYWAFGKVLEIVWQCILNNSFQCLNNITRIFIHFFIYTYFQKIQITLLEQHYQTSHKLLFIEKQCCAGVLSKIEQGGGENTQRVCKR